MSEEILIEKIKIHPCLYDKSNGLYKNKLAKEKAWMDVAASVGLAEDICQTKWKSLRDRFVKELKKPKSGSAADDCSNWKYFELMVFLKKYVAPRRTINNSFAEEANDFTSFSADDSCPRNDTPNTVMLPDTPYTEMLPDNSLLEGFLNETSLESTLTATRRRVPKDRNLMKPLIGLMYVVLVGAVQNLIEVKTTETKSRNASYFDVLDSYLLKLPEWKQDDLKMRFLAAVNEECANL